MVNSSFLSAGTDSGMTRPNRLWTTIITNGVLFRSQSTLRGIPINLNLYNLRNEIGNRLDIRFLRFAYGCSVLFGAVTRKVGPKHPESKD